MKKSELRQIIKEEIKKLNENKEYIIWGIPKGKKEEEILFTKAKNISQAKNVIDILEKKYNVKNARIQILDLSTSFDFTKTINI